MLTLLAFVEKCIGERKVLSREGTVAMELNKY